MIMKQRWGFKPSLSSSNGNHHHHPPPPQLPCEEPIPSDELDLPRHHRPTSSTTSTKQQQQQQPPLPLLLVSEPLPALRSRVRSSPDIRYAFGGGNSVSQQQRHSPNFLLPVHEQLAGTGGGGGGDDHDCLSPPVILTNSPITAPKATWENQYGYFLKQNKSPPRTTTTTTTTTTTRNSLFALQGGPLVAPPEALSTRSNSVGSSTAASTPLGASPSDTLTAGGAYRPPVAMGPPPPPPTQVVNDERSVRGGKLFSGLMFRTTSVGSSNTNVEYEPQPQQNHHRLRRNQRSSFSSVASSDELDETKRRGVEKAYSPGNPRFRKEHQIVSLDGTHHNTTTMPRLFPLLIPPQQQVLLLQQQHQQQQQRNDTNEVTPGVVIAMDLIQPTTSSTVRSPKSSAMKKIFTDFHNSAANTEVPYLGDEMSVHNKHNIRSAVLWTSKGHPTHTTTTTTTSSSLLCHGPNSSTKIGLSSLGNSTNNKNGGSILRPIRGVETWLKGRRYLLGPAVYASCHPNVLLQFQAPVVPLADCYSNTTKDSTAASSSSSHFGATDICLGDFWLSNAAVVVADHGKTTTTPSSSSSEWTQSFLIVRQNYLLDFASADCTACGCPRGILHLAYAVARPHEHFADTIYLSCYGSPCAKADPKRLLLRISSTNSRGGGGVNAPEERGIVRQRVVDCLNRAANLTLDDIYEITNDKESSLGESQYVQVRAVRKRTSVDGATTLCHRALKIFDKTKFWKAVVKGQERADTIVREISVQATLSSTLTKNDVPVVRIYGFFETTTEMVIELERLEGTDLFQYVSSKNVLSEAEAARILKDVLTALDTMSSLGLAHRDIKPANILMSSSSSIKQDDELGVVGVKVGDFGMSTFVDVDGLVRGRCGTPGYVAPEIFQTGAYGGYGNKVDVFSAGVTLYVCLCGYEPFYGETDQELKEANRRAVVEFPRDEWRHISPTAIDLIQQMMHVDPARRPSAREALAHEFFSKVTASMTANAS